MDTQTFLLFFASLLFSALSFYLNTKTTQSNIASVLMRFVFLACGFVGLSVALIVIQKSLEAL